jgi:hypothetical protein
MRSELFGRDIVKASSALRKIARSMNRMIAPARLIQDACARWRRSATPAPARVSGPGV